MTITCLCTFVDECRISVRSVIIKPKIITNEYNRPKTTRADWPFVCHDHIITMPHSIYIIYADVFFFRFIYTRDICIDMSRFFFFAIPQFFVIDLEILCVLIFGSFISSTFNCVLNMRQRHIASRLPFSSHLFLFMIVFFFSTILDCLF